MRLPRPPLPRWLLLALLWLAALPAGATGPSMATVRIEPVATNSEGVVLFKAYREVNYTGAHTLQPVSYWWLAVAADGLWLERPHAQLTGDPDSPEFMARHQALREEFARGPDWQAPPPSLQPLIQRFGFGPANTVTPDLGAGRVVWIPGAGAPPQRTLGGHRSGAGSELAAAFHHAGVALFRNSDLDESDGPVGAVFDFSKGEGIGEVIEYHRIDAIALMP